MFMSDHGFHSFRREVNLTTWLLQDGYLALVAPVPAAYDGRPFM
jgi:predicted AlkP superfamily phosphohydrolase/phosphomutase